MKHTLENDAPRLVCAVCLYTKQGEADDAVTVMGGTAVCYDHLGYVTDENVRGAIRLIASEVTDA